VLPREAKIQKSVQNLTADTFNNSAFFLREILDALAPKPASIVRDFESAESLLGYS
jgi:hypothetical protein